MADKFEPINIHPVVEDEYVKVRVEEWDRLMNWLNRLIEYLKINLP